MGPPDPEEQLPDQQQQNPSSRRSGPHSTATAPTPAPSAGRPRYRPRGTLAQERPDLAGEWCPQRNGDLNPAVITAGEFGTGVVAL
jgi:hypothetical protein